MDDLGKKASGEAQAVSAATEEQSASMEEIASSSQALAKLAMDLQGEVNKFQINKINKRSIAKAILLLFKFF